MYCRNCGNVQQNSEPFCRNCGSPFYGEVPNPLAPPTPAVKQNQTKIIMIISIIV